MDIAAHALSLVDESFVVGLSHLGVLSAVLSDFGADDEFAFKIMKLVSEKIPHDILKLCEEQGLDKTAAKTLAAFTEIHGNRKKVLERLSKLGLGENAEKSSFGA